MFFESDLWPPGWKAQAQIRDALPGDFWENLGKSLTVSTSVYFYRNEEQSSKTETGRYK